MSTNCDICDAGNAAATFVQLEDDNFEITYDDGAGVEQGKCPSGTLYEYEDGDRLVVTISYEVQPLVLFQGAGPFQVQFTAARTLMHQGIAMSGFDDVPAGNPHLKVPPGFVFVHDPDYRMACRGHFEWTTVQLAQGYHLFQWLPVAQHVDSQTDCSGGGATSCTWPLPGDPEYMYPVSIADIFYVQAYRTITNPEMDDSPPSNYVVINCLSKPEGLTFVEKPPTPSCEGYFEWDEVVGAEQYRFFYPSGISETVTSNRYPAANDLTTLNSRGPYTVTAFTAAGEGYPSDPFFVPGCTNPLDSPDLTLEDACSPAATFKWDEVYDAFGYRLYEATAGLVSGDLPTSTLTYSQTVANGEQYQVVPYNTAGPSGPSNVVSVDCGGPVDLTFYLHSAGDGWFACENHDGYPDLSADPPLLPMSETGPGCRQVHDYNSAEPSSTVEGREVAPLGGYSPPGVEVYTDTLDNEYLAWFSDRPDGLTITGTVTLNLWYRNPAKISIPGTVVLCEDGATHSICPAWSPVSFAKNTDEWTELVVSINVGVMKVLSGKRLGLYLMHGGPDSVWLIYDKGPWFFGDGYESRIEFVGAWQ
jgi:hypothetical protein